MADAAGDFSKLVEIFEFRCRELAIELPAADRIERIVRASINAHDERFYARIYTRLSPDTCTKLNNLLIGYFCPSRQKCKISLYRPLS